MKKATKSFGMGTVAACLAVGLSASGCKSKTSTPNDAGLNAALQNRIQADPGLQGQPIQATVQDGVATLSGSVTNAAARSLAANDAAEVSGIRTVVNNLSLGTPVAAPEDVTTAPVREVTPLPSAVNTRKVERPTHPSEPPAPVQVVRPDSKPPRNEQAQQQTQPTQPPPPPAPTFRNVTVPVGTGLSVRVTQTLDSASTQPGSTFSGALESDVIVDGVVAFPAGTRVTGRVDDAKDAGHFSGNSRLAISLTAVSRRGQETAISTDTFSKEGKGRGKNTAEKIGGGAAVGAILGGIFGGGKGAAIGAGAGGGLGAGANGVTRGEQVQIPSESVVRFRLASPVTVRTSTQPENDANSDLRRHNQ